MTDVFISYSQAEPHYTIALAKALQDKGYSVWWDAGITPGESIHRIVQERLSKAKASIVIWSRSSIESQWVHAEAALASQHKKLITVRSPDVDVTRIPLPFNNVNSVLVSDIAAIVRALGKLGVRPAHTSAAGKDGRGEGGVTVVTHYVRQPWAWSIATIAIAICAGLALLVMRPDLFPAKLTALLGQAPITVPPVPPGPAPNLEDGLEQVKRILAQQGDHDWTKIMTILDGQIASGRVDVEVFLAKLYLDGKGPKDWSLIAANNSGGFLGETFDQRARKVLEKAAANSLVEINAPHLQKQSIAEARGLLAQMLDKGRGGKPEPGRASRLLLEATAAGDPSAKREVLGDMAGWSAAMRTAIKLYLREKGLDPGKEGEDWTDAAKAAVGRYISQAGGPVSGAKR